MRLEETHYDNLETGCCAKVDSQLWDGRKLEWQDKLFLRDRVRAFLHIPLNFGTVIGRDLAAVQAAEAYPDEPLWLCDESSRWSSDFYVAVDREVPGATTEKLSGTFLTKVFEGPYRDAAKWGRQMKDYVAQQGYEAERIYYYYANCPRCAKRLGKNQIVLFAQVAQDGLLRASTAGDRRSADISTTTDETSAEHEREQSLAPQPGPPGWDVVDEAGWESFPASDPPAW